MLTARDSGLPLLPTNITRMNSAYYCCSLGGCCIMFECVCGKLHKHSTDLENIYFWQREIRANKRISNFLTSKNFIRVLCKLLYLTYFRNTPCTTLVKHNYIGHKECTTCCDVLTYHNTQREEPQQVSKKERCCQKKKTTHRHLGASFDV